MALKQDLQRIADAHASRSNELKEALADNAPIRDSLRSASFDLAREEAFQVFEESFAKALLGKESVAEKLVAISIAYANHIKALRLVFSAAIEADMIQENLEAMSAAYKAIYAPV
ncbi:MAG TPA: hypothetical protein VIS99_11255 [Terrimicrobiaceae bacterium]